MRFVSMSVMPLAPVLGGLLLATLGGARAIAVLALVTARGRADPDAEPQRAHRAAAGGVAGRDGRRHPDRRGPRELTANGSETADPPVLTGGSEN